MKLPVGIQACALYISEFLGEKFGEKIALFLPPIPYHATIKITERCNSRCLTCNSWKRTPSRELSFEEICDCFAQLKSMGTRSVTLTGGEPLLRHDLPDIIHLGKELGFKTFLGTNGLLLEKFARSIINAGIARVSVSVDGLSNTHNKMRGVHQGFERTIAGIKQLKTIDTDLDVRIVTTITKENLNQIQSLISLCKELGVSWNYNLLDTNPYFFNEPHINDLFPTHSMAKSAFQYLLNLKKKGDPAVQNIDEISLHYAMEYFRNGRIDVPCILGWVSLYIDSQANIYSGCWALPPLGSLKERYLNHILSSRQYLQRLKDMYNLNCPGCTCNYSLNCRIHHLLKWFVKNLASHAGSW